MKQSFLIFAIMFGIIGTMWWYMRPKHTTPIMRIGNAEISIEIADTREKQRQGLSERERLAENEGMLFVTGQNTQPEFWMKDMRFALDFIWIDEQKIVAITENVQPPKPRDRDEELKRYTAGQPIDYVLEVNAGFAKKYNLAKGAAVTIIPYIP